MFCLLDNLEAELSALSEQLNSLESLWETLSQCLLELEHAPDHHAVLVLQPAVEAFFLVHSPQQGAVSYKDNEKETGAATTEGGEAQQSNQGESAPTERLAAEPQVENRESSNEEAPAPPASAPSPAAVPTVRILTFL